jgi:hypothetical protein
MAFTLASKYSTNYKLYVQQHEVVRKDVEQNYFKALQSWFVNVQNIFSQWDKLKLSNILFVCVVLPNIIVEDEETKGLEP